MKIALGMKKSPRTISTFQMELQIPHSVCAEISQARDIRKAESGYRVNIEEVNISIAQFMGYLKGKSTLMIFDRHANLKYKYGNRHFWCRGYYVDTVGRNEAKIAEYVRNQLEEDIMSDQISMKEYYDPFTGSKKE